MIVDLFAGPFTCNDCSLLFEKREMFWTNKRTPTGQCRGCRAKYRRQWYSQNREAAISYSAKWKRENPERSRDANRKSKYGMPHGTYAQMLAAQGGCCLICGGAGAGWLGIAC